MRNILNIGFPNSMVRGDYLPPILSLELSNICNVYCIMCDQAQEIKKTEQKPEPYELTVKELSRVLEGVGLIRLAMLSGSHSEPLLNRDIAKIIYMLKNKKNAFVQVLTNGTPLTRHLTEKIFYAGLDSLRISIHGATKETAEKIMENTSFPRIISNIRETVKLKRDLCIRKPKIEIAFVGMKQNIAEFSDMVSLAAELGVDQVSLNSLQERQIEGLSEMKGQSLVHHPELLRNEYERALIVAEKNNIQISVNDPYRSVISDDANSSKSIEEINQPMAKGKTRYCLFPFEKPSLVMRTKDGIGTVGLCCSAKGRYVKMGNTSNGFASVWNGSSYVKIRKALLTGKDLPSYCYECERAPIVDPFVLQMDVALRQLWRYPNEEFRKFIKRNKKRYPEYVKTMKELGASLVPYETVDDLDRYIPVKDVQKKYMEMKNSLSWKIAAPFRWLGMFVRFAGHPWSKKREIISNVLKMIPVFKSGTYPVPSTDSVDKCDTTLHKHKHRVSEFKNKYKGERCFIIGNGPSLNKVDLRLLEDEYTFGVNAIFYKYDEMGFKPTFYMVEDGHVINDNHDRINRIDYSMKFFPHIYQKNIKHDENTIFFNADMGFYQGSHPYYCKPRFSQDCSDVIYAGQTVTYMCLQLAFYLGFKEVFLIGMDFDYKVPATGKVEGLTITSMEDDPNHFHPDYFGKGKKWHFPKLENCLLVYKHAKGVYEENGRKIFNATIGGKLEVYERVDFYGLFPEDRTRDAGEKIHN